MVRKLYESLPAIPWPQTTTGQIDTALTLIREPWGEDKLASILLIQEILIKNDRIDWATELHFADFCTSLLATCETVVKSPERFAQTVTGWALRELGKPTKKL